MLLYGKIIDSKKYMEELNSTLKKENNDIYNNFVKSIKFLGNHKNDLKQKNGYELLNLIFPVVSTITAVNKNEQNDFVVHNFSSLFVCSKIKDGIIGELVVLAKERFLEAMRFLGADFNVKDEAVKIINTCLIIDKICDTATKLITKSNYIDEYYI